MRYSSKEISKLVGYLEKREISPSDAIDIIHASTPEGQEGNIKFKEKIDKEAKNLFKLVTDPRQKHFFKSRYFVYEKSQTTIPQAHIDHLMQWPKSSEK